MRLFNRIEIFGRVTKDPQIRETVTESGVNYRLVWDIAQYQGKNDTAFWSCIMFGSFDYLEKESEKLKKGRMVFVAGQAKKTTKETKTASGAVVYSDSVLVQVKEINDCEGKAEESPQTAPSPKSEDTAGTANEEPPAEDTDQDGDGFKNAGITEDDIPEFKNDKETTETNTVNTDGPDPVGHLPDNTNIADESECEKTESTETTDQSVEADGGHSRFEN